MYIRRSETLYRKALKRIREQEKELEWLRRVHERLQIKFFELYAEMKTVKDSIILKRD